MYYDVTNGAIEEIGLAVSADGEFWARIGNQPVLPRGGPGQWDENYACEHAVVLRLAPNNFKMWYSGGVQRSSEGIGCATSPDGINWTKFSGNPIFSIYDGVAGVRVELKILGYFSIHYGSVAMEIRFVLSFG